MLVVLCFCAALLVATDAFHSTGLLKVRAGSKSSLQMVEITKGVNFDTVAREWRFKWTPDDDKASLASAQQTLDMYSSQIKEISGVKCVQRVVCGGCMDFKVITALDAESFGAWEQKQFAPEEQFLAAIKAIPGISQVETQTFTLMPV